jgi:hypothetical protein
MDDSSVRDLRRLYQRAFAEFGAAALWNRRPVVDPTPGDALAVARALRREGDMNARRLAEDIEAAAHAAH